MNRWRHQLRALPALLVLLLVGPAACGSVEEQTGTPHPRAGTALGKPDGRLRPPVREVLDTAAVEIARLDPDLRAALEDAVRAARAGGVRIEVNSGWRSWEHQQRLLEEAVLEYGSEEEALRWVSTPDASAHVTGDAVDIGPTEAADWLGRHGSAYGLCQVFANEIWHFELATGPGDACPPMYADSSER